MAALFSSMKVFCTKKDIRTFLSITALGMHRRQEPYVTCHLMSLSGAIDILSNVISRL